ncbi:MAG: hypothetical protein AB1340_10635 [Pseudomonadota bacterium]
MSKHMLPWPFMDFEILPEHAEAMLKDVTDRQGHGGATVHTVLTHLMSLAIQHRARESHGKRKAKNIEFVVGCGLYGHDMAREMLREAEARFLVPLCDFTLDTDAIYDELKALGHRALTEGEMGDDGILRV